MRCLPALLPRTLEPCEQPRSSCACPRPRPPSWPRPTRLASLPGPSGARDPATTSQGRPLLRCPPRVAPAYLSFSRRSLRLTRMAEIHVSHLYGGFL